MARTPNACPGNSPTPDFKTSWQPRIVYSSTQPEGMAGIYGLKNYSYGFVEDRMIAVLESLGLAPELIKFPAYYGGRGIPNTGGCTLQSVHLIFRPAEDIRPINGCYN